VRGDVFPRHNLALKVRMLLGCQDQRLHQNCATRHFAVCVMIFYSCLYFAAGVLDRGMDDSVVLEKKTVL